MIAKAFESAGVRLVLNSDAFLPQEIADSIHVTELKGCVYKAEQKEIDFANNYDPINKQAEIKNSIPESTRKSPGNKVQSLSDITSALIDNPTYDNEVTQIYEKSGYLTIWKYEKKQNPWRYSIELLEALPLSETDKHSLAIRELKIANGLLDLYKNNFEQYIYIK